MNTIIFRKKILLLVLAIVLGFSYITLVTVQHLQTHDGIKIRQEHESVKNRKESLRKIYVKRKFIGRKLAVLVPCRNCHESLKEFAPHVTKFLKDHQIPHHIFVLNQTDRYLINRGTLMNVGYSFVNEIFDYIAIHDIDTLPLNEALVYECPNEGVMHLTARHGKELSVSNEHLREFKLKVSP